MGRTRAPIAVLHVPTHLSAGQTRLMLALRACVDGRVETGNLDCFGLWQCRCSRGESGAPALQTARPLMGRRRRLTTPSRGRSRAMHAPAAGQNLWFTQPAAVPFDSRRGSALPGGSSHCEP